MSDLTITATINGKYYRLPEVVTLQHAIKLSIVEDKPIIMDYWASSIERTALIGIQEDKTKLLVKSEDEYTSPIAKIFQSGKDTQTGKCKDYIIMTENSIYIVSATIPNKKIS